MRGSLGNPELAVFPLERSELRPELGSAAGRLHENVGDRKRRLEVGVDSAKSRKRQPLGRANELRARDVEKLEPHERLDLFLIDNAQLGQDLAQLPTALDEVRCIFELLLSDATVADHDFAKPILLQARGSAHDEPGLKVDRAARRVRLTR